MNKMILILTLVVSNGLLASENLGGKLSENKALMTLIDDFSVRIDMSCEFSERLSYYYEHPEGVQSFTANFPCGEASNSQNVRVVGDLDENGNVNLFKIMFLD